MEPMSLAEAARLVFLTLAPIIATGAVNKLGEDITDTLTESLGRAWEAVERKIKRPLSDSEKAGLATTAATVEARLDASSEAQAALTLYRARPENPAYQQIVEEQIAEVFKASPDELLALARAISALSPPPAPQRQHTQVIKDNATVGTAIAGDLQGNLTIGSLDLSRNKQVGPAQPAASPTSPTAPAARQRVDDPALSADGVHFSFGHALLIGVGAYQHPRLSVPGGTTAADARALASLLRDPQLAAYPDAQVRLLADAKATRSNILDALEELANRVDGGTALIFFAGHGELLGADYALLPYDADLSDLAGTTLVAEHFHRRVAKIRERAKRLVVLLNCCHAGGVGDAVLDTAAAEGMGAAPPPGFYRPLAIGSGQVVICSSRPNQKSGARSKRNPQHTTFGAHLLDALRGRAPGQGAGVGIFELFAYLRAQVPADAAGLSYRGAPLAQEPLFYASQLDDNIAVALRPSWQGGTLSGDTLGLARRLAEIELAVEAAGANVPKDMLAEREQLLAELSA